MKALRRRLAAVLLDPRVALGALLAIGVLAALQQLLLTRFTPTEDGYTHYNNFLIFRQAFLHLRAGEDLYAFFPAEHFDNFLYSPTFAALMAPFAALPVWPGLLLWNLATAAVLALGVRAVPGLDGRSRALLVWFMLPEFIGAAQHTQTNPAIVGLLFLCLGAAERKRAWAAALFLSLAAYVKIFPLAAGLLFLAYPERVRLVLWTAAWMVILAAVPLVLVSPSDLAWQYGNWWTLHTTSTHAAGEGMSAEAILSSWFGLDPPRLALLAGAGLLTAVPLLRPGSHERLDFRAPFLGALLMWMIAFNHMSESPTYVIAMGGIALWYFTQERTRFHQALLWMAFLLVSVTYSDLVPPAFRARFIQPYAIKALPVVVIWAVAVVELTLRRGPAPEPRAT